MKKGIIFILLIVFLVFASVRIVSATTYFNFGSLFGGRIIYPKASQIAALEASGYNCPMYGTSISIVPIGSPASTTPTDFFIPSYVVSKTKTTPRAGQLIIGKYAGRTMITCALPTTPPLIQFVSLNTIFLFGTSRY